jgi:hypothetical protein
MSSILECEHMLRQRACRERDDTVQSSLSAAINKRLKMSSQAARLAGRNRSKFYSLLHRHALAPATFKTPRK